MGNAAAKISRWAALALLPFLLACTSSTLKKPTSANIQPLFEYPGSPNLQMAMEQMPRPALLAMTEDMRNYIDRHINTLRNTQQRMKALHQSLRSDAMLGIDYDLDADGSAVEVFQRGSANCLSYAHLFIAMARYAGLKASYHLLDLSPQWNRNGEQVALSQHLNVLVTLRQGWSYMVDIDPVSRTEITETRSISDVTAIALHHNNLAMKSLFAEDLENAYLHSVRALSYSPEIDFLWVNLGAVYSRAGNQGASAAAYRTALQINPASAQAMNNLMVLHLRRGEKELAHYWARQIKQYRTRNPYFHAALGEQAETDGNLQQAVRHYEAAIQRKKDDPELYYRLGRLHGELQHPDQAVKYLQLAVDKASLVSRRETYQALLKQYSATTLASLL